MNRVFNLNRRIIFSAIALMLAFLLTAGVFVLYAKAAEADIQETENSEGQDIQKSESSEGQDIQESENSEGQDISDNESTEEQFSTNDLGYWYKGIDETEYAARIVKATGEVACPGKALCAAWVSYVYQAAGLGFVGGDARDYWSYFGTTDNVNDIHEGMIIAVPHSPSSKVGWEYGHVGVIIKNPAYTEESTIGRTEALIREQLASVRAEASKLNKQLGIMKKNNADEAEIYTTQTRIRELTSNAEAYESLVKVFDEFTQREDHYCYTVTDEYGFTYSFDENGNEEWLVVHSTDKIVTTPLSSWVAYYNATNEIKWGWAHLGKTSPVNWYGEVEPTVQFAVQDDEEEETTESGTSEGENSGGSETETETETEEVPTEIIQPEIRVTLLEADGVPVDGNNPELSAGTEHVIKIQVEYSGETDGPHVTLQKYNSEAEKYSDVSESQYSMEWDGNNLIIRFTADAGTYRIRFVMTDYNGNKCTASRKVTLTE